MARVTPPHRSATIVLLGALVVAGCSATPPATSPGISAAPSASSVASPPTLPLPALQNITLEPDRVTRGLIGPSGGSLETTDAAGTTYRLVIPPGALYEETEMLAVPFGGISGLPAEAKVGAGVHFEPEGLVFRDAATLTITPASGTDRALLPFAYSGDLASPFRYPGSVAGSSVTLEIVHFSGYGLLAATDAAVAAEDLGLTIPWEPPAGATDQALADIAGVIDGTSAGRGLVIQLALGRWIDAIAELVDEFREDDTWNEAEYFERGLRLRTEFELWDYVTKLVALGNVPPHPDWMARSIELAVIAGSHAVAVANTDCFVTPDVLLASVRIPDLVGWLAWGVERGLQGQDQWLDPAFVAEELCVDVAFNPNGGVTFPEEIAPGGTGTLALEAGMKVHGGSEVYGIGIFNVAIEPIGTLPSGTLTATTSTVARYSHDFQWDPAADSLRLEIEACLRAPLDRVCAEETVTRGDEATSAPTDSGQGCLHRVNGPGEGHQLEHPMSVSYGDASGGMTARAGQVTINASTGGSYSAVSKDRYRIGGPAEVLIRVNRITPIGGSLAITVRVDGTAFEFPTGLRSEFTIVPVAGSDGDTVSVEIAVSLGASSGDQLTVTASPRPTGGGTWLPEALCLE